MINKEIGERLRQARKLAKVSGEELGDQLGVKKAAVSAWERGGSSLSPEKILKIAAILQVRPCWLLTGEGPSSKPEPGQVNEQDSEYLIVKDPNEEFILDSYREASEKDKLYIMGMLNTVKKAARRKF